LFGGEPEQDVGPTIEQLLHRALCRSGVGRGLADLLDLVLDG
jgi:hypothetical protein